MLPRISRLLIGAALSMSLSVGAAFAQPARAFIVVDAASGKVLASQNPDEKLYPASLTKMMTLYLTFEALKEGRLKWDDKLVMSENAESKDPFKFAVGVGRKITVKEAVVGMIVLSTNDAAVAIAEHLAGSEAAFGAVMTQKAHELGMASTTFTNPAGLPDPTQVTTATDMARLGMALMRDFPEEFHLFAEKRMEFRGMKLRGHNGVLMAHDWADGIKTGYTEASGYNLVTSAKNGSQRLVGVVLGSHSEGERDAQMVSLMEKYLGLPPTPAVTATSETPEQPAQSN